MYLNFVTPWAEPAQRPQSLRIDESYHIPQCYNVHAPPVQTKLPNFAEDTLFYAFYASPQDMLQLESAEELCVARAILRDATDYVFIGIIGDGGIIRNYKSG